MNQELVKMIEHQLTCYICYEKESKDNPYASEPSPCICKGSIVIHQSCLKQIITKSRNCSICKTHYNVAYLPSINGYELITEHMPNGDVIEYTINIAKQRHGTYYRKNSNGQILKIYSYINGKMDGPWVEYYPSGQIKLCCRCKNDSIDGDYTEWYRDGTIKEESFYINGLKEGECIKWKNEGGYRIGNTLHYQNGLLVLNEEDNEYNEYN
jgi:hypothetical protein